MGLSSRPPASKVNISDISRTGYTVSGNVHLKGDGQTKDLKLIVEAGVTVNDRKYEQDTVGQVR
ncbi:hypothetical protein POZ24_19010 [Bacteroides uniformis]|uniref:Uncharacterized protein n=1 Tax=Bacteroides uniformis TaxID=820 RepID=A0AAW6GW01_BACUN|nr:hypothetical protein [Bacteroides uniformis]MDC1882081.1 hypothetical protein [Bacteroides uniformis]MDC1886024.1 hypothetical protein [Bacteroides uniformis]